MVLVFLSTDCHKIITRLHYRQRGPIRSLAVSPCSAQAVHCLVDPCAKAMDHGAGSGRWGGGVVVGFGVLWFGGGAGWGWDDEEQGVGCVQGHLGVVECGCFAFRGYGPGCGTLFCCDGWWGGRAVQF